MDYRQYEPIFGSWYITDEIGSGAEGRLFRICRTDALGHKYYSALKAISVPGSEAETASMMAGGTSAEELKEYYESVLENTTQEFEFLAKLKGNSNIVSYEDHEVYRHSDGLGWDILIRLEELIPLVKYSIDNPLSEDEVARMGRDICRGLSLCNKYGIVHRDLKPDNIFISPSGSYKLGDFGIARIIDKTTAGLSRKGTYEYMAPEIYWGREYGTSADLYSLGMVMYRYLNDGRMPLMPQSPEPFHAGDREEAFIMRMSGREIQPPHNGCDELKRIVLKACEYDKSKRYGSAEEMLRDLEALKIVETDAGKDSAAAEGFGNAKKDGSAEMTGTAGRISAAEMDVARARDVAAETSGAGARRSRLARRIALIAAVVIAISAGVIYAAIPKEVEDIYAGAAEGGAEIYIGEELAPTYTVTPDRFKDEPITFTSSDEKVAEVDGSGVIHAETLGEAVLTMQAKEYSEETLVKVIPKVTSISGIDEEISLTTGDDLELKPKLAPDKFADEPLTYSTKDDAVAKVSSDGKLQAVSAGKTTLKISAGGCTAKSTVTVSDPVVYTAPATKSSSNKSTGSKKKPSSSKKKKSGKKGYFDSGDDEHF